VTGTLPLSMVALVIAALGLLVQEAAVAHAWLGLSASNSGCVRTPNRPPTDPLVIVDIAVLGRVKRHRH
jgi:hypothetical protein